MADKIQIQTSGEYDIKADAISLLGAVAVLSANAKNISDCLEQGLNLICEELGWPIGHAFLVQRDEMGEGILRSSGVWFLRDPVKFAELQRVTAIFTPDIKGLPLAPQWRIDVRNHVGFQRAKLAQEPLNVGAAFNLPIVSGGKLVAVLEFFNDKSCSRDESILKISAMLALNFARAFEIDAQMHSVDLSGFQNLEAILNDRMSAMSEMARGVSHEINNPLTIALGHLALLRSNLVKKNFMDPIIALSLDKMSDSMERVSSVVKSMRLYCKEASDDPVERIPVAELIQQSLHQCANRFLSSGAKVIVIPCPDQTLEIESMGSQVSQALVNVINNAIDAVSEYASKWIEIRTVYTSKRVKIFIIDSGTGIPPNISSRIMDPFYTTKIVGKGSGLGLSSAKGVIEAHGGKLYFDQAARNTTFVFDLALV